MLKDNSYGNGPGGTTPEGYAVFMEVVEGWDVIESVVARGNNDDPDASKRPPPVKILRSFVE